VTKKPEVFLSLPAQFSKTSRLSIVLGVANIMDETWKVKRNMSFLKNNFLAVDLAEASEKRGTFFCYYFL
jgi:hypothetical protein